MQAVVSHTQWRYSLNRTWVQELVGGVVSGVQFGLEDVALLAVLQGWQWDVLVY